MKTIVFQQAHLQPASRLFAQNYARLRQAVPVLPDRYEYPDASVAHLASLLSPSSALAFEENGELLGYLGWYLVEHFRGTDRKAAYCPVWAHAAIESRVQQVYGNLYPEGARIWTKAGCQLHAITLFAHDHAAEQFWFWNGFGAAVVDAVRPLGSIEYKRSDTAPSLADAASSLAGFSIRKAVLDDLPELMRLDAEHWASYLEPPILMAPQPPRTPGEMAELVAGPLNSVWTACQENRLAGFITFTSNNAGSTLVVKAESTIAINGAYVQAEFRRQGVGTAILAAACRAYQELGYERCSVDFESFNPQATAFWLRYFDPVCLSLIRTPERTR